MSIAGNDVLRAGMPGTFQDPVVRFVRQYVQFDLGLHDFSDLGDVPDGCSDLVVFPVELLAELFSHLRHDRNGGVDLYLALYRQKPCLFSPSTFRDQRRDVDIRIEDGFPHLIGLQR